MYPQYPFKSQFFDLSGLKMHYVDEGPASGSGGSVVCVHGNPTWSFYFRNVIAALRDKYRCVAMDHIGMGLSDKPNDSHYEYTLARRVDDLEALIEHLNLGPNFTMVVHDWGGMIGMAYAVRHPDRIAKLVVLNTAAFALPAKSRMPWQLSMARTPLIGALLVRGFNAFSRGAVRDCVTARPLTAEIKQAYLAPHDSWAHRVAVHRFVQDIPLKPGDRAYQVVAQTQDKLSALADKPMLIGWGMRDFVFDAHFLEKWIEYFPGAQVHRFDDSGHFVLEDAADRLLPLISEFVAASTG